MSASRRRTVWASGGPATLFNGLDGYYGVKHSFIGPALGFYQRSGFRPYAVMVEVHPDPRLAGQLPRHASPQVPLIDG